MRRLITQLRDPSVRPNSTDSPVQKLYKDYPEGIPALALSSTQQAKIVPSKVAARIIRYYAYEARYTNETAVFALNKFCEIGVDNWIKQVTNFSEDGDVFALLQTMNQTLLNLNAEVSTMKAELFKTEGYRAARVTFPGLREWMESLDVTEYNNLQLPGDCEEQLFTLNEWAQEAQNGLILSRSNKHALANMVSATYKAMALEPPPKVQRLNKMGHKTPAVQAYPRRHFVLLNMCYSKMIASS